jgi:hypothetical protein
VKVVFASAAIMLMLAAPALAQSKASTMPSAEQMLYGKPPEQIEKEAAADKAYRESLKKIPDAKASSDPWGSARGADAAKTAAVKKPPVKRANSAN